MIRQEYTLINKNVLVSNKNFKELKERMEKLEMKVELILDMINKKEKKRKEEEEETIDDIINQAIWSNIMYC